MRLSAENLIGYNHNTFKVKETGNTVSTRTCIFIFSGDESKSSSSGRLGSCVFSNKGFCFYKTFTNVCFQLFDLACVCVGIYSGSALWSFVNGEEVCEYLQVSKDVRQISLNRNVILRV